MVIKVGYSAANNEREWNGGTRILCAPLDARFSRSEATTKLTPALQRHSG